MSDESLKKLIENMNTGKSFKVLPLVKNNPEIAAYISKLVRPRDKTGFDLSKKNGDTALNQNQFFNISESNKSRIKDNEDLLSLFPDIELAIQILTSSVLSPKDMVKTDIIYKVNDSELPSEVTLALNTEIETSMRKHYKLEDECNQILRETLFTTGSYIKVVIPESAVDEMINGTGSVSTESMKELFTTKNNKLTYTNLNYLGNAQESSTKSALEKFSLGIEQIDYTSFISINQHNKTITTENLLDIVDNYNILKLPRVAEAIVKAKVKTLINNKLSLEAYDIKQTNLNNVIYKEGSRESKTLITIPTMNKTKRKSIGRPLVFKLPTEATIPVYTPGNEKEHVGYFVLLDIDGNPVTRYTNQDYMQGLTGILNNNSQANDLSSLLINKAKTNLTGQKSNAPIIDELSKIYSSIVEKDLMDRLKNGIYKNNLKISNSDEVYRIMLARTFANQYTRLVFVPAELVTYFAFNYHENGTGKSYLDELKILTSLRAILLFSKVMAMVKSAINLTHVNLTLDPNDPDPQATIELATHSIVKMRQQYFPLGINSPVDLVDWIQRAGFEFSFEGHPGLPQTKLDFEVKNMQHTVPDSDLDELLRKQTYMSFGLSPETVDNGFNSEFATTVVSNNILLSKRIIQLQNIFTKHLTDHCQKICANDIIIRNSLKKILLENISMIEKTLSNENKQLYKENHDEFLNQLLDEYLASLQLDLPKPDETSIETQVAAFDSYTEALDKTLDHWISTDLVSSDVAGDVNSFIDVIKSVVKSHYIRKWMADNNFMSELSDIVTTGENDKPSLDIYEANKGHIEGLTRNTIKFIDSLRPSKLAANNDLESMNAEASGGSSDSSSIDDSNSGGDGMGSDDTGMGDMGMGDIGGGDMGSDDADATGTGESTPEKEQATDDKPKTPEEE